MRQVAVLKYTKEGKSVSSRKRLLDASDLLRVSQQSCQVNLLSAIIGCRNDIYLLKQRTLTLISGIFAFLFSISHTDTMNNNPE